MRVLRELVSAAVCPERVLRGPGPPALLRSQFPWIEALRVTSMVPCIKVPRWSFSLARKHLLDSFPYFLWAQGHYHLSHRGSLLRKEKENTVYFASKEFMSSFHSSICRRQLQASPNPQPATQGRESLSLLYFLYLGHFCCFCFMFAMLEIKPRAQEW